MENNKNKKSVKFQGDMLNFCDFIQVFVFTTNHHLKELVSIWKIPSSNDFVNCNTCYCQQCSLYILIKALKAQGTPQSLLIGNQDDNKA